MDDNCLSTGLQYLSSLFCVWGWAKVVATVCLCPRLLCFTSISLFPDVSCFCGFTSSVNMLNTLWRQTQTYCLPHPPILFPPLFFLMFPPLLPVYGSTSELSSVMSLACLTDTSLERNLNSCNMVMQGKSRDWESTVKCASDYYSVCMEEWSWSWRKKGIPPR